MKLFKLTDTLLKNSNKKSHLWLLEKILSFGIPFNGMHRFKIKSISPNKVVVGLPFIRRNKNHLGGIHACAIATLGEYPAGLSLLKNFGAAKYRIILKSINTDFHRQGRAFLTGHVDSDGTEIKEQTIALEEQNLIDVKIMTEIYDDQNCHIASVTTLWQIKKWSLTSVSPES